MFNSEKIKLVNDRVSNLEDWCKKLDKQNNKLKRILKYGKQGDITYNIYLSPCPVEINTRFYKDNEEYDIKGLCIDSKSDVKISQIDNSNVIKVVESTKKGKYTYIIDLENETYNEIGQPDIEISVEFGEVIHNETK